MVWRLISNNWYSILVNGQTFGFFESTRGLKQGGSLSPTLFIIAAEVLARSINSLNDDAAFRRFANPKCSKEINHQPYADDTILLCSRHKRSMKKMMEVLRGYEYVSGQLINLTKSYVYLHEKVLIVVCQRITCISQGYFPFTNLGCPIFYGRNKK